VVIGSTTTKGSQVNTYDGQGRLTRQENNGGMPSASVTTFAAWDTAGRPTVANDVGRGFNNRRDITYDDTARTRTTRVNGGVLATVETFDANGNLTQQSAGGGQSGSTRSSRRPRRRACASRLDEASHLNGRALSAAAVAREVGSLRVATRSSHGTTSLRARGESLSC